MSNEPEYRTSPSVAISATVVLMRSSSSRTASSLTPDQKHSATNSVGSPIKSNSGRMDRTDETGDSLCFEHVLLIRHRPTQLGT